MQASVTLAFQPSPLILDLVFHTVRVGRYWPAWLRLLCAPPPIYQNEQED